MLRLFVWSLPSDSLLAGPLVHWRGERETCLGCPSGWVEGTTMLTADCSTMSSEMWLYIYLDVSWSSIYNTTRDHNLHQFISVAAWLSLLIGSIHALLPLGFPHIIFSIIGLRKGSVGGEASLSFIYYVHIDEND